VTDWLHPRLLALQQHFATPPLTSIDDPLLQQRQVQLWIKRDDLIHPIISGNKWRKLKYPLNQALQQGATNLISMGGAYSNHLHALAYIGHSLGLSSRAFIRGEPPAVFNSTLLDLQRWGMQLQFVSRSDYRKLRQYSEFNSLPGIATDSYWLPEGGAMALALAGVGETLENITVPFDVLATACGTGTTLAGLAAAAQAHQQVLGIAALTNAGYLVQEIQQRLQLHGIDRLNWQLALDYHCGGFAKTTPALLAFIEQFQARHNIPLEPVYTGKMLFGLYDLIQQGHFSPGQTVIALHTGGIRQPSDYSD
jgi:1-aminocyclopropane-1-carboxylate deaminase